MPRLQPKLLHQARSINPLLARLLPACRELSSAKNELRWLHEHAEKAIPSVDQNDPSFAKSQAERAKIVRNGVEDRRRGKPLQYVLGSQPFGDLDILCRPGVLIPRRVQDSFRAPAFLPTYHCRCNC